MDGFSFQKAKKKKKHSQNTLVAVIKTDVLLLLSNLHLLSSGILFFLTLSVHFAEVPKMKRYLFTYLLCSSLKSSGRCFIKWRWALLHFL